MKAIFRGGIGYLSRGLCTLFLLSALTAELASAAAPVHLFGVGHTRTFGQPGELYTFDLNGDFDQRLFLPTAVNPSTAATIGGKLLVAEFRGAIESYTLAGDYLGQFADLTSLAGQQLNSQLLETDAVGNVFVAFGGQGTLPRTSFRLDGQGNITAQFSHPNLHPTAIDAAANGDVYIMDAFDRLIRFTSAGDYVNTYPLAQLNGGSDIAISETTGELYVADYSGGAVLIYDLTSGAPVYQDSIAINERVLDVFIEPKSGRIFGTYSTDLGAAIGFEISRNGTIIKTYSEDAANTGDNGQNFDHIIAIAIPEPTTGVSISILLLACAVRRKI